jgi:hypothetical protein
MGPIIDEGDPALLLHVDTAANGSFHRTRMGPFYGPAPSIIVVSVTAPLNHNR